MMSELNRTFFKCDKDVMMLRTSDWVKFINTMKKNHPKIYSKMKKEYNFTAYHVREGKEEKG